MHPEINSKVNISKITLSSLPINSLILGCIESIKDYELSVCLPSGIHAKVAITQISSKYSTLLNNYSENPENNKCPHKPNAMFRVGQCLPLRVINKTNSSTTNDNSSSTYINISASINPIDVNQDINPSVLFSISQCLIISASVHSIEDHGYIMDVGLEGLSGTMMFFTI